MLSQKYSELDIYKMGLNYKTNNEKPFKTKKDWYIFIRGIFDNIGTLTSKTVANSELVCTINIQNHVQEDIEFIFNKIVDNNYKIEHKYITIYDYNAFDFLSKIYDD